MATVREIRLLQVLKWMVELTDNPCPYEESNGTTLTLARQLIVRTEQEFEAEKAADLLRDLST